MAPCWDTAESISGAGDVSGKQIKERANTLRGSKESSVGGRRFWSRESFAAVEETMVEQEESVTN